MVSWPSLKSCLLLSFFVLGFPIASSTIAYACRQSCRSSSSSLALPKVGHSTKLWNYVLSDLVTSLTCVMSAVLLVFYESLLLWTLICFIWPVVGAFWIRWRSLSVWCTDRASASLGLSWPFCLLFFASLSLPFTASMISTSLGSSLLRSGFSFPRSGPNIVAVTLLSRLILLNNSIASCLLDMFKSSMFDCSYWFYDCYCFDIVDFDFLLSTPMNFLKKLTFSWLIL